MSILLEMKTPVFAAEGVPELSVDQFRLKVTGLVDTPKTYMWEDLIALPFARVDARLTSVSGWSVRAMWEGIRWRDFLADVQVKTLATHVTFSSHGGHDTTVSLQDLSNPRVMLVYSVDSEQLEPEYGGPLRILIPNLWGYKSCKWLVQIDFTDSMKGGYWEDRGYTRNGVIEPGRTYDVNTKTWREITGGEVTEF